MSIESASAFRDQVGRNPELQTQVKTCLASGQGLDQIVALGKQHGFQFTPDEAETCLLETGDELSEFELEMVAGGAGKKSGTAGGGSVGGGGQNYDEPDRPAPIVGGASIKGPRLKLPKGW